MYNLHDEKKDGYKLLLILYRDLWANFMKRVKLSLWVIFYLFSLMNYILLLIYLQINGFHE